MSRVGTNQAGRETDEGNLLVLALLASVIGLAAGLIGGPLAPVLVLGAQAGLFFALACRLLLPGIEIDPEAFATVAMAASYAGVVRAPVTGIALVTEMTGSTVLFGSSSTNIAQPTACIDFFGDLGFRAGGYIVTCNKPSIWSCSGVGVLV